MWITGGTHSPSTTELVDLSSPFNHHSTQSTISAQPPLTFRWHCATQINSTHGILTGGSGSGGTKTTLIVDLDDFTMTSGPTLLNPRGWHSCTRISAVNGTDYVIVAGSHASPKTSEILVGNSWKNGMY